MALVKRHVPVCFLLLSIIAGLSPATAGERKLWPGKKRWKKAFFSAVKDPGTWAPAAAATVITVGDYDPEISEWAVKNTPIFGSSDRALQASNTFLAATQLGMVATSLAIDPKSSWKSKLGRLTMQWAAASASTRTTRYLKTATDRPRPNGLDRMSFPSGHATGAFAYATLGSQNLQASELPRGLKIGFRIGLTTLAAGTAWARVEGGVHYPSDVLAGACVGNFVTRFINHAFLGDRRDVDLHVSLNPDAPEMGVWWRF